MYRIVQVAALVLILSFAAVAQSTQGLVAYYPFSGNANDVTGNGHDGQVPVSGPILTFDRSGNPDAAFLFDGVDDSIVVLDAPALNFAYGTVCCWVRFEQSTINPRLVSKGPQYELYVNNDLGGVLGANINSTPLNSTYTMPIGQWVHAAFVKEQDSVFIYADGIRILSTELSGSIEPSASNLLFGRNPAPATNDWLKGDLDEVRIYNRPLSDVEILSLYQGLVAYYPFEGNANDATPNKNDGVVTGPSLTTGQNGQSNSAYFFDGQDDYIRVMHSPSLNIDQNLTLSYWVKFQRVGSSSGAFYDWQCIVMKTSDGNSFGSMVGRNRELRFYHRDTTSTNSDDWYTQHELGSLQSGRWYHIALTYTGANVFHYVNGEQVDSFPRVGRIIPNPTDMLIGRDGQVDGAPSWYPLEGSLDELRIYDRALSAVEIKSQFESEAVPGDADGSGLVTISDAVYLINYVFGGGPAPAPIAIGDANGDCRTNISDCVCLINFIFGGGSAPIFDPNCVASNKRVANQEIVHLEVASSGKTQAVVVSALAETQALQLGFTSTGKVGNISVTCSDPRLQVFSGWVDGEYRVGLIDLTGKTTLSPGSHDLLTINYEGTGELILNNAIVVDSDAQEMNVTISSSKESSTLPTEFSLSQNQPNPFNPTTQISFSLPKPAEVNLTIFNILGEKVVTLTEGARTAGVHSLTWDGRDSRGNTVASGVYFYRLDAGEFTATKKMLIMK